MAGDDTKIFQRAADSWFAKNVQPLVTVAGLAVFGGGGAFSLNGMSAKQDATNEKLDKMNVALVELKSEVGAGKDAAAKLDALVIQLVARVSMLEQHEAAAAEKGREFDRRLTALEGKR